MTEEEYHQLKQSHDECVAAAERAQGGLDQLVSRLKREHNCDLGTAEELLADLRRKQNAAEKNLKKAMNEYARLRG